MEGLRISHYRILRHLGSGGMGEVYAAEDERLLREIAIKFLPREKASDEQTRRRFEREAQTASALNHPNICMIFEIGEHKGQLFLVMELLEGSDLRRVCGTGGTETPKLLKWASRLQMRSPRRMHGESCTATSSQPNCNHSSFECKRQRKCTVDEWPDCLCEKCSDSFGNENWLLRVVRLATPWRQPNWKPSGQERSDD